MINIRNKFFCLILAIFLLYILCMGVIAPVGYIWLYIFCFVQLLLLSLYIMKQAKDANVYTEGIKKTKNENEVEEYIWYFLENSPIAEIVVNEDGSFYKYNSAFSRMMGNNHDLLTKGNFFDIMHDHNKNDLIQMIKLASNEPDGQLVKPIEVKILTSDDLTALLYVNRMVFLKSKDIKLICRLIDITEQKKLELHFSHAQKMQAVGQLAGGIAHDFNNLLTAMIGFSDLLLVRHPAGDQSFADIMQIKQNANRAANLVRQLLAFSRKQVLNPEIIDVTEVLAESSHLVRRLIGENIELNMIHGRDLHLVKVDQVQLEQVIINLAVNARDAMVNGGILTVRTSNVNVSELNPINSNLISPVPSEDNNIEPGEYVLIEVSDTGCGIKKELIGKIFEPFFSTKEIGAGTGLGLATVYGVVKQTGGYIYLTTEEGKGASFSIFLKSCSNKEEIQKYYQEQEVSDKVVINDLTGKGTILLVEDEVPVRIFSAHALINKGYKVLEAENAHDALEIVGQHGKEIDIIITDVIMPGMNGPSMIERVSNIYPDIKVIFISGYAEDAFIKAYGSDRNFNFLPKPFTLKQLATKVKEVLGGEK